MTNYNAKLIIDLRRRIEEDFTQSDWQELGLITDCSSIIDGNSRLLRSLHFGDEDYSVNILSVLKAMSKYKENVLNNVKEFLDQRYPDQNFRYISEKPSEKKIVFAPSVFSIPEGNIEEDLVAVMMPFAGFSNVYNAIKAACYNSNLRCLRADDIWENSVIMQDIFSLIFKAKIVIVDFSMKNPNVMYETGIAHTLGKTVVPLTQSVNDLPSDTIHHRALIYLNNGEGLQKLTEDLTKKLKTIKT